MEESSQDTVKSKNDQVRCRDCGFETLLLRRRKAKQKLENHRHRCQEVQRVVRKSVPIEDQFNPGVETQHGDAEVDVAPGQAVGGHVKATFEPAGNTNQD